VPTKEQVTDAFRNSMYYEILHTFGVPAHVDPRDIFQWEQINYPRVAHARLLYDFFRKTPDTRTEDDVFAADYDFHEIVSLSTEDRKRVNKDLLHFSYGRLRHDAVTKRWPDRILSDLLPTILLFMNHIEANKSGLFSSMAARAEWGILIEALNWGYEVRVRGQNGRYLLAKGDVLPGGKPRFTTYTGFTGQMLCGSNTNTADPCHMGWSHGPPPQGD
jgi:hypothetical protein